MTFKFLEKRKQKQQQKDDATRETVVVSFIFTCFCLQIIFFVIFLNFYLRYIDF